MHEWDELTNEARVIIEETDFPVLWLEAIYQVRLELPDELALAAAVRMIEYLEKTS